MIVQTITFAHERPPGSLAPESYDWLDTHAVPDALLTTAERFPGNGSLTRLMQMGQDWDYFRQSDENASRLQPPSQMHIATCPILLLDDMS